MNIFAILEGLISSVPEAIALYHKIVPMISVNADIHPDQIAEVDALAPVAINAVDTLHTAIAAVITTHVPDADVASLVTPPAA